MKNRLRGKMRHEGCGVIAMWYLVYTSKLEHLQFSDGKYYRTQEQAIAALEQARREAPGFDVEAVCSSEAAIVDHEFER